MLNLRRAKEDLGAQTRSAMSRAKIKSVKVMGVLVTGFIVCWTPYYTMALWWWIDQETAQNSSECLQKLLWAFACANNCVNPVLYQMTARNSRWKYLGHLGLKGWIIVRRRSNSALTTRDLRTGQTNISSSSRPSTNIRLTVIRSGVSLDST